MAFDEVATAKEYYNTEIGSSSNSTTDNMKIRLMYVSDYGYAAAPSNWTTALYNYNRAESTNWLYLGGFEWTISRSTVNTYDAFHVGYRGYLVNVNVHDTNSVHPSFYLKSSVSIADGTGTSSDPYRLSF